MWVEVGKRVERIRKNLNLSKSKFGKMIGVSGQYIGKVEKGAGLSAELIVNICRATGTTADYILFGTVYHVQDQAMVVTLCGLSTEQINIALDIIKKVAQFINTEDGNELLIREVASQLDTNLTPTLI